MRTLPVFVGLALVSILSTFLFAADSTSPSYQVINEGEEVSVQIVDRPEPREPSIALASPLDRVTRDTPITVLMQLYRESYKPEDQARLLEATAGRRPRSLADLQALMGLFMKEDQNARATAETSLRRIDAERDSGFAPFFLNLLENEDPVVRLFGLIGVDRLRPEQALPSLLKTARTPFQLEKPALNTAPRPANEWLFQYQTLDVLASWQGEKVFDIVNERVKESPDVAKVASTWYWKAALPRLLRWSRSKKREDQTRALAGWRANPPIEAIKSTREALWDVLDTERYPVDIRHQAALKLGLAADDSDLDRLLELRSKMPSGETRVLYDAALFASRSERAVPILVEYVQSHPDASARSGALTQLSAMVSPERYRELLRLMADSDPDAENRSRAQRTLELSR